MSRSPREYIRHIIDEIDYILSQLPGQDFHSFSQNPTLKRAFVRSLEIIGEASRRFPKILGPNNRKSNGGRSRECVTD